MRSLVRRDDLVAINTDKPCLTVQSFCGWNHAYDAAFFFFLPFTSGGAGEARARGMHRSEAIEASRTLDLPQSLFAGAINGNGPHRETVYVGHHKPYDDH